MPSSETEFYLRVNGDSHAVTCNPSTPLLFVLRNELGLMGTRQGCTTGHCGACMIQQDGTAIQSCSLSVNSAIGELTTIEGLGSPSQLHPLQQRFFDDQAAQCCYCINGILMSIDSVIRKFQSPNMIQIKKSLGQHLCRCGSHSRILEAIRKVLNSDRS